MSVLEQVRGMLLRGGCVLLPSDTCYSLGALPINEGTRANVNAILDRNLGPISLAFGSYPQVQEYVAVNAMIALLLERFTPGAITIVCKARDEIPDDFLMNTIGSSDRTIGVRIPDSHIEREIAASTQYPLMTVAVRETGAEIRDFRQALEVVTHGTEKIGGADWAAIEGDAAFRDSHSTVIRVSSVDKIELIREGDIPFADIQGYVNDKGKHLLNASALARVKSGGRPDFPSPVKPSRAQTPHGPSTTYREWWWGAFALGSVLLTSVSGLFFVAIWVCCAMGIYRAPWFRRETRDERFVLKGLLLTLLSILVFAGWEMLGKSSARAISTAEPTPAASAPAPP
jgi:L-threonylcarbamoyladenylate synthase